MANPEQALALAQAARIQSLEEELVILRDLDRSKGDELDTLRTALQRKEFAYKDLAASERLAQAELAKSAGAAQDLEEVVGAVREELRAAELGLLAEKEARTALGEKLTEQQRQLSEATTKLAKAAAAEQAAREQAARAQMAQAQAVQAQVALATYKSIGLMQALDFQNSSVRTTPHQPEQQMPNLLQQPDLLQQAQGTAFPVQMHADPAACHFYCGNGMYGGLPVSGFPTLGGS